jgi:hypothetical protein
MVLLTDGLKAFAGESLRRELVRFTGTPLKAFGAGTSAPAQALDVLDTMCWTQCAGWTAWPTTPGASTITSAAMTSPSRRRPPPLARIPTIKHETNSQPLIL